MSSNNCGKRKPNFGMSGEMYQSDPVPIVKEQDEVDCEGEANLLNESIRSS